MDSPGVNLDITEKLDNILTHVRNQKVELEGAIEQRFNQLKSEFHGATLSVVNEVKKLKRGKDIQWKHKGNQIQFDFNTEIKDLAEQCSWAIDHNKVDYANELILQSVEKIKQRNKLIRLADTSEAGWDTVKQYESNPIASDSEDESKIIKAENRALRKRKQKNVAKSSKRSSQAKLTRYAYGQLGAGLMFGAAGGEQVGGGYEVSSDDSTCSVSE